MKAAVPVDPIVANSLLVLTVDPFVASGHALLANTKRTLLLCVNTPIMHGEVSLHPPKDQMWIAVTERFRRLDAALLATDAQVSDARVKIAGIVKCLNAAYYSSESDVNNGVLVGSWGKQTQILHTED